MSLFNSGKFRALRFAREGELAALRQRMLADTDHLPRYHVVPRCGHLNDPNGLVFDGEKYHLFYQWYPFGPSHGMKHWKHLMTRDFIHFDEGDVLEPDTEFETHGIYSGGAVVIDEAIYCFYSGNVQDADGQGYTQNQNIAKYSKAGKLLEKWNIVPAPPAGYSGNFRDPAPFFDSSGQLFFVIGAQTNAGQGVTLLYRMASLTEVVFEGEVHYDGIPGLLDGSDIYMHECPELSRLGQRDMMIISPMGLKPQGSRFNNIFSSLYLLGEYRDGQMQVDQADELDRGFDFYAPQTVSQASRNILLAWCGNGSLDIPTVQHDWKFLLTLPRELTLEGDRLIQRPLAELEQLQRFAQRLSGPGCHEPALDLRFSLLRLAGLGSAPFTLGLFDDGEQRLVLRFDGEALILDRSHTLETADMQRFGSQRQLPLGQLDSLDIYLDNSVVEIFINGGEQVMTARFFIEQKRNQLVVEGDITLDLYSMQPITLYQ